MRKRSRGMVRLSLFLTIIGLAVAGEGWAFDLLNDAARQATLEAQEKLQKAVQEDQKLQEVKRIAVIRLEADQEGQVSELMKVAMARGPWQVVLREDKEWETLLSEFERQIRHADIIEPDTVSQLSDQGVDAILFGDLQRYTLREELTKEQKVHQGYVRILLKLADLKGNLLWADQIEKMAEMKEEIEPPSLAARFKSTITTLKPYKVEIGYGLLGFGGLLCLYALFKGLTTPR